MKKYIQIFLLGAFFLISCFISNILVYREILPYYICVVMSLLLFLFSFLRAKMIRVSAVSMVLLFLAFVIFVCSNFDFTQIYSKILLCAGVIVLSIENGIIKFSDENKLLSAIRLFVSLEIGIGLLQITLKLLGGRDDIYITGTFDNPMGFALTLVLAFPFMLLFNCKKGKFLWYLLLAVVGGMIVLTSSRACILALLAILLIHFLDLIVGLKNIDIG